MAKERRETPKSFTHTYKAAARTTRQRPGSGQAAVSHYYLYGEQQCDQQEEILEWSAVLEKSMTMPCDPRHATPRRACPRVPVLVTSRGPIHRLNILIQRTKRGAVSISSQIKVR